MDLPPQLVDLCKQLRFELRRTLQVQPRLVRRHNGQVRGDRKDVAHRPRLEKVKRDVEVVLEQRLERDESLLNFLCRIPVRRSFRSCVGPTLEELLHGVDRLARLVVGGVDDVVEKELGDEAEQLREEDRGHG